MQLCFAPMDGITTCATRLLTQEIFERYWHKSDSFLLWTEFMNVDGFLINPRKVIKHLLTTPDQKPIAQIYGGNKATLLEATKKIQKEYAQLFSGIELNTGCPSTTVMKVGGGSDMMRKREDTFDTIKCLYEETQKAETPLPFSIKARTGLHEEDKREQQEFLLNISPYCSKISLHGRTLKQLYQGEADWEYIARTRQHIKEQGNPNCLVIGNGGISGYEQAQEFLQSYAVDGIMIWQGAIGNPRIFTPHIPTKEERLETVLRHLDLSIACDQYFEEYIEVSEGEIGQKICIPERWIEQRITEYQKNSDFSPRSIVEFRKFLFQYIKGIPDSREWKQEIVQTQEYTALREKIIEFFG